MQVYKCLFTAAAQNGNSRELLKPLLVVRSAERAGASFAKGAYVRLAEKNEVGVTIIKL